MEKSKGKKSHNVYYQTDKYRIRIYRNDHKIYEKQASLPKLSYNSISREIIVILREFISKISLREDIFELYDSEYINSLNKAAYLGKLIENLRSKDYED